MFKQKYFYYKEKYSDKTSFASFEPSVPSKGNVLVSYLISPFKDNKINISKSHTNEWECYRIVSLFLEYGYSVDIINFDDYTFVPKKKYAYFIDIHSNMERISPFLDSSCIKILHITGAHWMFQNQAEYTRLLEVQKRKGVTLMPRRMAMPCLGIENCNYATILGNQFTKQTFQYANKPIHRIHITTTQQFEFNSKKEFDKVKKCFLWFGGAGMVHKGLDITLEAFSNKPDFTLYVVGPVQHEKDFVNLYHNELYQLPNIKTLGWVDVESSAFGDVVRQCVGIILPSCSEGGGGSVITGLHAGLIPVVSYEASIDVFDFGYLLKDLSVNSIIEKIDEIAASTEEILSLKAQKAWNYAREFHTQEKFENEYRQFLKEVIKLN